VDPARPPRCSSQFRKGKRKFWQSDCKVKEAYLSECPCVLFIGCRPLPSQRVCMLQN
jgi:hypothetical protein